MTNSILTEAKGDTGILGTDPYFMLGMCFTHEPCSDTRSTIELTYAPLATL